MLVSKPFMQRAWMERKIKEWSVRHMKSEVQATSSFKLSKGKVLGGQVPLDKGISAHDYVPKNYLLLKPLDHSYVHYPYNPIYLHDLCSILYVDLIQNLLMLFSASHEAS